MSESKAAKLPTPVEVLKQETERDEAELVTLKEQANNPPNEEPTEELAEDSLPSEDNKEPKPKADGPKDKEPVVEDQEPELIKSKRGQERVKKLLEERRQAQEEAQRLREENKNLHSIVQALQDQGYTRHQAEQIAQSGTEDQYLDPQTIARQTEAIVNQKLTERESQQNRIQAAERYQEDLKVVEEKYSILNEDAEDYDEELATFIGETYTSRLEKNPRTRLTDVTEQIMKLRHKAAEQSVKEQVGKVARQASQQAIAPSGGKTETTNLAQKIAEAEDDVDLAEVRKLLPQGE